MPAPDVALAASFPYHTVPDGSVLLPHHATWALLLSFIPIAVVWDDHPKEEPVVAALGVLVALIGFLFVWPRYPILGAALTVTAVGVVILAATLRLLIDRETYPWPWMLAVLILAVVASDDVLQHAFGVVTPLDWLWKHGGRALLPSV